MAPKRAAAASEESTPKRLKKVMNLEEKVKLLDKCKAGRMSNSAVGKLFNVNESTVRSIKKNEAKIRAALASTAPPSAKQVSQVRSSAMSKMESALYVWITDQNKKGNPIDSNAIRAKGKALYDRVTSDEANMCAEAKVSTVAAASTDAGASASAEPRHPATTNPEFLASKGWFDKFKRRFSLHNLKMCGESGSADHVSAAAFPGALKKIIDEKGYRPEQVWNMDETGLYWKKMPNRTFVAKEEKRAPGFKAAKSRCTLMLCANAAGHTIKPGFIYKSANPRALKGRNKNLLPVFWMHNTKAWTTNTIAIDWFHHCFLTEVRAYLQEKGLPNKILLLLDNAPGHPVALDGMCDDAEVVFMPPNTTSLIQPLDQGVIAAFKAYYTRRCMQRLHAALDANSDLSVIQYWKTFTIADCLSIVRECLQDLRPQTVIGCWRALWPECVCDFVGFGPEEEVNKAVKKTVELARLVGGEGFTDMQEDEVRELVAESAKALSDDEVLEIVHSESEDEEEASVAESNYPQALTLEKLGEAMRMTAQLKQLFYDIDPSMVRALKVMSDIDKAIVPYKTLFDDMKRKHSQLPITMFFTKKTSVTPPEPQHTAPERQPVADSDPVANLDSSDIDDPPALTCSASGDELESH